MTKTTQFRKMINIAFAKYYTQAISEAIKKGIKASKKKAKIKTCRVNKSKV